MEVFKGIVSDSTNIFLWHESNDMKKKMVIIKISVNSNFTFTSYAWLCALTLLHRLLCFKIKSRRQDFMRKLLLFHTEIISAWFLCRNVLLKGELPNDAKFQILTFSRAPFTWNVGVCLGHSVQDSGYIHHWGCRDYMWKCPVGYSFWN